MSFSTSSTDDKVLSSLNMIYRREYNLDAPDLTDMIYWYMFTLDMRWPCFFSFICCCCVFFNVLFFTMFMFTSYAPMKYILLPDCGQVMLQLSFNVIIRAWIFMVKRWSLTSILGNVIETNFIARSYLGNEGYCDVLFTGKSQVAL